MTIPKKSNDLPLQPRAAGSILTQSRCRAPLVGCSGGLARPPHSRFPIAGPASTMSDRDDQNPRLLDQVDDAEGVPPKQVPASAVGKARPRLRLPGDREFGSIHLGVEPVRRLRTSLGVPASGCLRVGDRFVEILKRACHVQRPRGYGVGPPTRERCGRCPRQPGQDERGSRPTTRPRRQHRPRCRGFRLTLRRAPPAPRRSAEGPQRVTAWSP